MIPPRNRWVRRVAVVLVACGLVVGTVQVVRARARAGPATPTAGDAVATATVRRMTLAATDLVNATVGFAPARPLRLRGPGTVTWLPAEGSILTSGSLAARVDGAPVLLLAGAVPAWRGFAPGMADGDDVLQLERGLRALGFGAGSTVDRHFGGATSAAVRRWQHSMHRPATGALADGDVLFAPVPVRVAGHLVAVGAPVGPGVEPYAVTTTSMAVHAALDASRQDGVKLRTPVTVDFLDGRHASGHVSGLGTVVTPPSPSGGSAGDGAAGPSLPTVPLTVTLSNQRATGALDQQPVQLELTRQSRANVLAVPVTALVALAEGGYAVETVDGSGRHALVAVTPGLYASGYVQLTRGPAAGTTVVVAQ